MVLMWQLISVLIPAGLRCQDNSTNSDPAINDDCLSFSDASQVFSPGTSGGVSKKAQGLLTGPAFTVVYTLSGIPLSWLADRWNRLYVLVIGLAIWTLVTFGIALVHEFWQVHRWKFDFITLQLLLNQLHIKQFILSFQLNPTA
jgi:MFS family permease